MKKRLIRSVILLLALSMLICTLGACADTGTPMLTLKAGGKTYTYSRNLYELQLATLKARLVVEGDTINGYNASQDAYWNSVDEYNGKLQKTDDYWRARILDDCRYILVALYLFDHYGLKLSESEKEDIEEYIQEFVKTDGDGSENKLNSVLSQYHINIDMLREHCTNTAKVNAVREHLYSKLGNNIKENYLKEQYAHFNQIFLANYNYVYMTDANGDEIYYSKNDNTVLYQKTPYSGTDKNGKTVYYTDATREHYAYDTENGVRVQKQNANGSGFETEDMTDEELIDLELRAELLYSEAQGLSPDAFNTMVAKESDGTQYDDGYYLPRNEDYSKHGNSYYYLDTIIEKLEDAEAGDVIMVESGSGYHIVMKLDPTRRAYEKECNQTWFESSVWGSFTEALTQRIFLEECKPYYSKVSLDKAIYADAASIRSLKENYYYY